MFGSSRWRENYLIVNRTLAGWAAFMAALPLLAPMLSRWWPRLWSCPYLRLTGHPCPFCGITRDCRALFTHEPFRNGFTPWLVLFMALELAIRLLLSCRQVLPQQPQRLGWLLRLDGAMHLVILLAGLRAISLP